MPSGFEESKIIFPSNPTTFFIKLAKSFIVISFPLPIFINFPISFASLFSIKYKHASAKSSEFINSLKGVPLPQIIVSLYLFIFAS